MKTTKLFLIFVAFTLSSFSQEVPKGANLLIFKSDSLQDAELFKSCILVLRSQRFTFDQMDNDFYFCTTKPIQDENSEYKVDIVVKGNMVEIRSYVRLLGNTTTKTSWGTEYAKEDPWERGANRSFDISLWRHGWNKQIEIGEILRFNTPGLLIYEVEKTK